MANLNEYLTLSEAAKLPGVSKDTRRRCDRADRLFDPQVNGLLTEGQGMAYSFLSKAENDELVARLQRARQPEEERYREKKGEVYADFSNRGLTQSSVYVQAVHQVEVEHIRNLFLSQVNELFHIVEKKGKRLSEKQVGEVKQTLLRGLGQRMKMLGQDIPSIAGSVSIQGLQQALKMLGGQIGEAVSNQITIRASEVARKQGKERQERWVTIQNQLIGVAIGILGTLVTQWVACE